MAAAEGPRPFSLDLEETLSQLHLSFSLSEEQKTALEAFVPTKDVFCRFADGIRQKHNISLYIAPAFEMPQLVLPLG